MSQKRRVPRTERDLTVSEVLNDPLIAQMRKADSVGHAAFTQLMQSAARVHARQVVEYLREERAAAFYHAVDAANSARDRAG
jgi:hypothetical protein